jgi:hypothetical protein
MQVFASEIAQLRALGFAEALSIDRPDRARDTVARLESGRYGLAVEFFEPGCMGTYSVVPLECHGHVGSSLCSDTWSDVLRDVRRRTPPHDDD